ncbi:DUF2490 domain-containing protein [Flavobacterium urocaniciphilum]|uniref:DUF2490 domain-containing protein n=1 Tax=Flavobacterium urocaniciphilum TaxID=1299341 RepID=A0A1H9CAR0_9FLAO|nr:DUF2490 domain-containing protein [Flavobacterium urocaniciphilum]SEP98276.1 Protein of unknown function [Flavobacterium urocaniciphilum]
MKKLFVIIIIILPEFLLSQKNVEKQQLIWYGYYNNWKLNQNWEVNSEIQERQFFNPTAQHQLVFRSNLVRKLKDNWNESIGMTLFFQNPNVPNSESNLTVPELRPDIGFSNKQKWNFLTINHRYKVEARFFHDVENDRLVGGYRFSNFRFRYQLGFDFSIWKKENMDRLLLKIKDEIMINVGDKIVKNTFDQNRIYLAINFKLNHSYALEMGYMNWFQQQKSGTDFYNRDILRFSVFHTIN